WAFTGMWTMYGIMQFPGGVLSDVYGRKIIITLSALFFSIATFLTGFNINAISLIITFSLIGMAAGILPAPSFTMIAELFGPRKGKALGIHSSIGSLSGFAPLIVPFLALFLGWRYVFILWGVLGVFLTIFIYKYITETLERPIRENWTNRFITGLKGLAQKEIFFMFLVNLVISFAWMGMLNWFPTYLQQVKGFGPELAGLLFAIMMSGGLLFKPVIGHMSDRINRLFIMMLLTFLAGVSLYFLTVETSIIGLIIVSFLLSQTGAFYPVRTSYVMDFWDKESAGAKLGVFRSLIVLLGSPVTGGAIAQGKELYGFNTIILVVSAGLFITAGVLLIHLLRSDYHPVFRDPS
ncbi:MAG: MFS transporter, partial [Candidatus Thermoplasmatota archaeon]|nr:MFS transporter [Candidatus Thermoplasmatota archaeon]